MRYHRYFALGLCLILGTALSALAPGEFKDHSPAASLSIDNTTYVDVNAIFMFVTNHGIFGRDLSNFFGNDYGTYFPYGGDINMILIGEASAVRSPLYSAGIWMGGVDSATGDTLVTVAEYGDEYAPGPMASGTFQADVPEFRVYKLYSDSLDTNPNTDYQEYLQYAVAQGAPIEAVGVDTFPAMAGDQMLWSVYNDADASRHNGDAGNTAPMGIEVRQTTFAFDGSGLDNVIFLRWGLFNKGSRVMKDFYVSLWADPDLGGSDDDLVCVDTVSQTGCCYNGSINDTYYGSAAPCLGLMLLQGPARYTGDDTDTAMAFGTLISGYVDVPLSSFRAITYATDPMYYDESYNYMLGLDAMGFPYMFAGDTLMYMYSGNPIVGSGDYNASPDDYRFLMTAGPIDFRPGDSTEIVAALVIGQGSDPILSIIAMRSLQSAVRDAFASLIEPPLAAGDDDPTVMPSILSLEQNRPNPFNPGTTIEFALARGGEVELSVFNILGEKVATLVNKNLQAGSHRIEWKGLDQHGRPVPSGVYVYRLSSRGASEARKMVLMK